MKRFILRFFIFMICVSTASAAPNEKPIFGPKAYDVKARYGAENRYKESFRATEGVYFIKIQNGDKQIERSTFMEFTVNDRKLLKNASYEYPFIAVVIKLRKENSFELVLKDEPPSTIKRPQLPPRHAVLSVMQLPINLEAGVYGVHSWEMLQHLAGLLQKIKAPESFSLAVTALGLENDGTVRAEAARKLSARKDTTALDFFVFLLNDDILDPDVKSEFALALGALGNKESIPLLMKTLLDPVKKVRTGAATALSFYSEDDTRELFTKMIRKLDNMAMEAMFQTISESGWKPVGALMELAGSPDPYVANAAITLLGASRDSKATEFLLKRLKEPRGSAPKAIIAALGESKDARAIAPLSLIARDPEARKGVEPELAMAFASLGDQETAALIEDMIKDASEPEVRIKLRKAYRKLTGKGYKK